MFANYIIFTRCWHRWRGRNRYFVHQVRVTFLLPLPCNMYNLRTLVAIISVGRVIAVHLQMGGKW